MSAAVSRSKFISSGSVLPPKLTVCTPELKYRLVPTDSRSSCIFSKDAFVVPRINMLATKFARPAFEFGS